MIYEITTQQGTKYQVNDDNAFIWIGVEKNLGYTFKQAIEKMTEQSLDVITMVLFLAAQLQGKTELKSRDGWVQHEFAEFDIVEASVDDPKDTQQEASSATS